MRIGLIAMSGVRACDPELVRLGMTLPGFVERGKVIASLPSLGLLTLAGMTPAHHSCEYHEVKELRALGPLPDRLDLVAISSLSAQIHEAYELADRYRAIGIPVVMGGLHVTALPEEASLHADAVVIGEGEPVWLEVLRDAETGRLKRFYRARREFSLEPMRRSPRSRCLTRRNTTGWWCKPAGAARCAASSARARSCSRADTSKSRSKRCSPRSIGFVRSGADHSSNSAMIMRS